jgi:hypothetical protein
MATLVFGLPLRLAHAGDDLGFAPAWTPPVHATEAGKETAAAIATIVMMPLVRRFADRGRIANVPVVFTYEPPRNARDTEARYSTLEARVALERTQPTSWSF